MNQCQQEAGSSEGCHPKDCCFDESPPLQAKPQAGKDFIGVFVGEVDLQFVFVFSLLFHIPPQSEKGFSHTWLH
jgi:hypothetical protein